MVRWMGILEKEIEKLNFIFVLVEVACDFAINYSLNISKFHAQTASQHKSAALKGEIYLRVSRRGERPNPTIIELFQLHSQQEP